MPAGANQQMHEPTHTSLTEASESAGVWKSTGRPSFRIETHGCKLNMADSQSLAGRFMARGFQACRDGEEPSVYVVNTCTVTAVADKKARQAVSSARRRFPGAIIVAAGCYPERDRSAFDAFGAVDLIFGNRDKTEIVDVVSGIVGLNSGELADAELNIADVSRSVGRSRAAVKIQEGCDQICAYCIVPRVRGRERSLPPGEIVDRIGALSQGGCPEVVLTGTQLGTYGFDIQGANLRKLLIMILTGTDIRRLRVSSLQPQELDEGLLGVWEGHGPGRLAPHFHMPLQSGSDPVLNRMRRRYTASEYERAAAAVREAVPGASITTDVICGFPGETEQDHENTLALMRSVRFADAHVFPYSSRPGTSAAHYGGHVDSATKARRAAAVRRVASESAAEYRRGAVGERRTVLWEGQLGRSGLTEDYLRVAFTNAAPGGFVSQRIEPSAADSFSKVSFSDPVLNRLASAQDDSSADDIFERVKIVGVKEGVLLAEPV